MIQRVNLNLDAVEALLFFWHSIKDRQKVSELFMGGIPLAPPVL